MNVKKEQKEHIAKAAGEDYDINLKMNFCRLYGGWLLVTVRVINGGGA